MRRRKGPLDRKRLQASGFTAVELLVAMGVVSILVALILPAVQSGREAARRTSCSSHLRQVAIATEAFVGVHGRYPGVQRYSAPAGNGGLLTEPLPPQPSESIHARLLPFLELENVYWRLDRYNVGRELAEPPMSESNEFALEVHVPAFVCPSDDVPSGGNSYRGSLGSTTGMHATWRPGMPLAGTIDMEGLAGIFQSRTPPQRVRDGLSQTVLFSERVVGDRNSELYTPFQDLAGLEDTYFYRPNDAVLGCAGFSAPDATYSWLGTTWVLPHYAHTAFNHVLTPNSRIPDCMNGMSSHFTQGAMTARSMHPGGVNVAFADGSVTFVSESVDLKVWRAIGSMSGGEVEGL